MDFILISLRSKFSRTQSIFHTSSAIWLIMSIYWLRGHIHIEVRWIWRIWLLKSNLTLLLELLINSIIIIWILLILLGLLVASLALVLSILFSEGMTPVTGYTDKIISIIRIIYINLLITQSRIKLLIILIKKLVFNVSFVWRFVFL